LINLKYLVDSATAVKIILMSNKKLNATIFEVENFYIKEL